MPAPPHITHRDSFDLLLAGGRVAGLSLVHKFGHNPSVGTTSSAISIGGFYRMPQVSGATKVRVKAGDVADTNGGAGAWEIVVSGIDETGAEVTDTLTLAGTSASAPSTITFLRLFRAYVTKSGTYATVAAGSHVASIVVENEAGTEDWVVINGISVFPESQSNIAAYTGPLGNQAFITQMAIQVDTNKVADIEIMQRQSILDASPPYSAMRVLREFIGIGGDGVTERFTPYAGPYPALTDIVVFGSTGIGTAAVSVDLAIILEDLG